MRTRCHLFAFFALLTLTVTLAACSSDAAPTVPEVSTQQAVTIRLAGSGTAQPLIKILAESYRKGHPDVLFDFLPEMHSGGGIKGVNDKLFEVGLVSREPTAEEKALGLTFAAVSSDGLALAANPAGVTASSVTTQQVKDVYSGKITNWAQLGGADAEIVVLDRNEDESAKLILRKYLLGPVEQLPITDRAVALNQESDMVEGLLKTPHTFGYLSLGYLISQELPITILSLDGVKPSVESIASGAYHMVRPLGVVVRPDAEPAVKDFVTYLTSADAKRVMQEKGFAPASPAS